MALDDFITPITQNTWAAILLILLAAYTISHVARLVVEPIIRRTIGRLHSASVNDNKKRQDTLISLLRTLFQVTVWTVTVFIILGKLGINVTALLAGAGVLGVAIGFGAQSLIKDFLSGLFIILENQYRVGDVVELGESSGVVEQITVRSTIMRDLDGNVHFIPNGTITHVINKTLGFSKINLTIKVQPDTSVDNVAEIINQVGSEMTEDKTWKDKITQAPHFSSLGEFTETSLSITIAGTTLPSEQWAATNELRKRLLVAFRKHKIELAAA